MTDIQSLLSKPEFPLSGRYDSDWIMDNQMGPNALWLIEWLLKALPLKSGMRVLDLGCGRSLTSIFMAREFNAQVWAVDLWITPDHNRKRAEAAGVGHLVFPLRAEAHALPFSHDFFDVIVSIDAYHYFGTDMLYLNYLSRFLRPDGYLGIVVPGLMQPVTEIPEHLARPQSNGKIFWEDECWSFKTPEWWHTHWRRNGNMSVVQVDTLTEGWRHWVDFEKLLERSGKSVFPSDAEAIERDQGRYIGFVRAIARRIGRAGMNLYDPRLGIDAGVDR
ncbi:MAG: cyclopropane-fatty-acyl-phospholipid synthase family protein [Desulfatirhabdiaceae bacterium]